MEEELELSELLNAPLSQIPLQSVLNVHWLAVNGMQTLIPENEFVENDSTCYTSIKDEAFVNSVDRKPRVKHVLTEEVNLHHTKVTEPSRVTTLSCNVQPSPALPKTWASTSCCLTFYAPFTRK